MAAKKRSAIFDLTEFQKPINETETDSDNVLQETKQVKEQDNIKVENILPSYKQFKQTKPLTVEETHTRDTYLIENELLSKLNKQSKKEGKGYKKWFINEAIKLFFLYQEGRVILAPAEEQN